MEKKTHGTKIRWRPQKAVLYASLKPSDTLFGKMLTAQDSFFNLGVKNETWKHSGYVPGG